MTSPAVPAENPAQTPAAPDSGDDASPSESGDSTWFDAITGRGQADFATDEETGAAPPEQPGSGAQGSESTPQAAAPSPQPQAQPQPDQTSPSPDDVVRLTRTQFEREVQSRADKLIAKRAREDAQRAKEAELDRKLEEDPFGFAEEVRTQRKEAQSLQSQIEPIHTAILDTSRQYDTLVVDRVVMALPPEVRQKLHQEIQPVGIEGRSKMVEAALGEIKRAAIAEGKAQGEKAAEQKLRKSDAFRKELLAELRGSEDEPELLNGSGRSPQPADMDDWIRMAASGRA